MDNGHAKPRAGQGTALLRRATDAAKAAALRAGFPLAGVAPAQPPSGHEHLGDWIAAGYAGAMGYLARDPERRRDPARLLPGARSVLVVGAPYLPPREEESARAADPGRRGVVSSYARGDDYHAIVEARLAAVQADLARALAEIARDAPDDERRALLPEEPPRFRAACDHAPLLERPLGARAGIGWVGKNTLLLHRAFGSWFFLGALLTSARLLPDQPQAEFCGSCRRCLDACPTGAFPEPYVLDARRCISYLTIELRGTIPRELRPLVGARVFGCDDCQTVCPWTPGTAKNDPGALHLIHPGTERSGARAVAPLFPPRDDLERVDLRELLAMNEETFRRRFEGTPMTRPRRRGLRRNAAVALGNVGAPEDLDALAAALDDGEALLRAHAAWAVAEIARRHGGASVARARSLLAARRDDAEETDPAVREELDAALGALG